MRDGQEPPFRPPSPAMSHGCPTGTALNWVSATRTQATPRSRNPRQAARSGVTLPPPRRDVLGAERRECPTLRPPMPPRRGPSVSSVGSCQPPLSEHLKRYVKLPCAIDASPTNEPENDASRRSPLFRLTSTHAPSEVVDLFFSA